jgi:hypothetical protein
VIFVTALRRWRPPGQPRGYREAEILLSGRQEIPEDGRQLFSETTRLGDGFELPVDILRVALLANADTTYDYYVMLRINSIDDAMVAELVLPITCQ